MFFMLHPTQKDGVSRRIEYFFLLFFRLKMFDLPPRNVLTSPAWKKIHGAAARRRAALKTAHWLSSLDKNPFTLPKSPVPFLGTPATPRPSHSLTKTSSRAVKGNRFEGVYKVQRDPKTPTMAISVTDICENAKVRSSFQGPHPRTQQHGERRRLCSWPARCP